MRRIGLRIAYDGASYVGWQKQENGLSIQEVIENTIEQLFHERISLMGSGRTDAGVHALGQVAAMDLSHPIPTENLKKALNANLPEDIRIFDVWEADPLFHPRFDAKRKTYGYTFFCGEVMPPSKRSYEAHISYELDISAMKEACAHFIGTHDFKAFRSSGGMNLSTARTVYDAALDSQDASGEDLLHGSSYIFRVTGNGFLYNMVRIMAGTLFEIGKGKITADRIDEAYQTGDRNLLGPTAPAQGLCLLNVSYDLSDEKKAPQKER